MGPPGTPPTPVTPTPSSSLPTVNPRVQFSEGLETPQNNLAQWSHFLSGLGSAELKAQRRTLWTDSLGVREWVQREKDRHYDTPLARGVALVDSIRLRKTVIERMGRLVEREQTIANQREAQGLPRPRFLQTAEDLAREYQHLRQENLNIDQEFDRATEGLQELKRRYRDKGRASDQGSSEGYSEDPESRLLREENLTLRHLLGQQPPSLGGGYGEDMRQPAFTPRSVQPYSHSPYAHNYTSLHSHPGSGPSYPPPTPYPPAGDNLINGGWGGMEGGREERSDPAPKFSGEKGESFNQYEQVASLWWSGCNATPRQKLQRIVAGLSGRPRDVALSLGVTVLQSGGEGMGILIGLLSKTYAGTAAVVRATSFELLMQPRGSSVPMHEYLVSFGINLRNYARDHAAAPVDESLLGMMLFRNAKLSETQEHLVRATWDNAFQGVWDLLDVLEKQFPHRDSVSGGTGFLAGQGQAQQSGDPALSALQKELGVLKAQLALFQGAPKGGSPSPAVGGNFSCRLCQEPHRYGTGVKCGAQIAKEEADGYCRICKRAAGHFYKDCEHYDPEYFKKIKGGKRRETGAWVGRTGSDSSLRSVARECVDRAAGVLDGGCTATVMGTTVLEGFRDFLGPLPLSSSPASYEFGEGKDKQPPVDTIGRVTLTLRYGNQEYLIPCDVVEGDLPLLISKADQIGLDGNTLARQNIFSLPGPGGTGRTSVPLGTSDSGHWLLPLAHQPAC